MDNLINDIHVHCNDIGISCKHEITDGILRFYFSKNEKQFNYMFDVEMLDKLVVLDGLLKELIRKTNFFKLMCDMEEI